MPNKLGEKNGIYLKIYIPQIVGESPITYY